MLTSTQAAVLNNKIAAQLKAIGDALCPPSQNNTEGVAWDYYVAAKIEAYGKASKKAVVKLAIKQGVLFDHEKTPKEPGTDEDVYHGDVIAINLKVKEPSQTFDGKKFYAALVSQKLVSDSNMVDVDALYEECFKESRPAHTFTPTLLSE